MTRWNPYASDNATEAFLRGAAAVEGLSYHAFCDKYGIADAMTAQQVRRHEVFLEPERIKRGPESTTNARAGRFHRGGLIQRDGDRDPLADPPFVPVLPSDFARSPKEKSRAG